MGLHAVKQLGWKRHYCGVNTEQKLWIRSGKIVLKMGQKYPRFLETNQNITFAKPLKMPVFVMSVHG